jgi:hypothetical protein
MKKTINKGREEELSELADVVRQIIKKINTDNVFAGASAFLKVLMIFIYP